MLIGLGIGLCLLFVVVLNSTGFKVLWCPYFCTLSWLWGFPLNSHSDSLGLCRSFSCNPWQAYWNSGKVSGREVFYNLLIKPVFSGPIYWKCFCPPPWVEGPPPHSIPNVLLTVFWGFVLVETGRLGAGVGQKSPPLSGTRFQYYSWGVDLCYGEGSRKVIPLLFFPFHQGEGGIFLRSSPWALSGAPGGKRVQNCGAFLWLGPQVFLTHTSLHSVSSNLSQLLVKQSHPYRSSDFCCLSLDAPVSPDFRVWFTLNLHFCDGPEKGHWFSVCPAFSCCKDGNGVFQDFYTSEWKPEVCKLKWIPFFPIRLADLRLIVLK